ncbi:uncharacterized protein LOC124939099 [Impatiens glandulifera]|uniref:uncharacterized protein LOC124939099 n=1 Tax=Impatiens glandulifera TaxID=253017 RepID=UPI001FB05689|nr:uncharacterized protein LOC124939099 [Impatiens glandulifera]
MDGRKVLLVIDNCLVHSKIFRSILEGFEDEEINPEKINVLDAIIAISSWMNNVKNITIENFFQHCKLRSVENVVSQLLEEGIRELRSTIKELHYRNAMNVDQLLDYPDENNTTEILTDKEIIDDLRENNQDEDNEDDSHVLEPISRKEAIRVAMQLSDFLLQYDISTPQFHKALQKVRDEIQMDINFHTK